MPIISTNIYELLSLPASTPILDVRSPGEYNHAHIPGAISYPIFTNEERKEIGTAYKQESRDKAIKIGLDAFGQRMRSMVEELENILSSKNISEKKVALHCWRGGMRSGAVAWLLDMNGYEVHLLKGGYKSFRKWVLQTFEEDHALQILGGNTGGNKTGTLQKMKEAGMAVIDLEEIARHMGSAFGNLDNLPQPSQEQFENELALQIHQIERRGKDRIWLEGESQRIGLVNIPTPFFKMMRNSVLFYLDIPFEERLNHIVKGYGKYDKEKLQNAILRIKKRLGGLETNQALEALNENRIRDCFAILLSYYDKHYHKSIHSKTMGEREILYVTSSTTDAATNAKLVAAHEYAGKR